MGLEAAHGKERETELNSEHSAGYGYGSLPRILEIDGCTSQQLDYYFGNLRDVHP